MKIVIHHTIIPCQLCTARISEGCYDVGSRTALHLVYVGCLGRETDIKPGRQNGAGGLFSAKGLRSERAELYTLGIEKLQQV